MVYNKRSYCRKNVLPTNINLEKKMITNTKSVAERSIKLITKISQKLANEIKTSSVSLSTYLSCCNNIQEENCININELKSTLFL